MTLVGTTEIAQMLGVSRQRASQLSSAAGFPKPLQRLAAGPVWNRAAIERWMTRSGRG